MLHELLRKLHAQDFYPEVDIYLRAIREATVYQDVLVLGCSSQHMVECLESTLKRDLLRFAKEVNPLINKIELEVVRKS